VEGHVARVVLAHPRKVRVIAEAKVKTDQIDARVLAELLACDHLPAIWIGDERSRGLRRQVSQRRALVKRRTALKNEVSAALMRRGRRRSPPDRCTRSRSASAIAAVVRSPRSRRGPGVGRRAIGSRRASASVL
jgi:transposase